MSECSVTCNGNDIVQCGGPWRAMAYNFSCTPYQTNAYPWQDPSLPAEARVADLISRLSAPQLIAQLIQNGGDVYSPTAQLPRYIVSQECLAGFDGGDIYIAPTVNTTASSAFPQPVNMGTSWDAPLVRELANAISDEARAAFTHYDRPSCTCMSPNLNVRRDERWGRSVESFSEDPMLISALGAAYIQGLQYGLPLAPDAPPPSPYLKVFSIPKHLGAYSVDCYNSDGSPNNFPNCQVYRSFYNAVVDDIDLRETYYPGWQAAFEKDTNASGVMCSYNAINGVPSCANGALLRDALETDWGMKGLVISDADAVAYVYTIPDQPTPGHMFASSLLQAAVDALLNGTTVSLEDTDPDSNAYVSQLPIALEQGLIQMSDLQAAARRALLPRFAVGLYDPPALNPWTEIPASVIESEAHHALARRAAAQSYVLLKNEGVGRNSAGRSRESSASGRSGSAPLLPLLPPSLGGPTTIAVVGPASNCTGCSIGRYTGSPAVSVSVWQGVSAAAAALGATAIYGGSEGPAAVSAVAAADVAVVVLTSQSEGESHDRESLALPPDQLAFLLDLAVNTTTPLIVCVISGGAVDLSPAVESPSVRSIIAMYSGGMEAGSALADILYGIENPSGALASTVYKNSWINASDFLNMSVRGFPGRGYRYMSPAVVQEHELFPFGFGLSYTSWSANFSSVAPLSISAAELAAGANVSLAFSLANTGEVAGSRVIYALLQRVNATEEEQWPYRWLPRNGFVKLHDVEPGQGVQSSSLVLTARDVSRWDIAAHAFVVQSGSYLVALRDSNETIQLTVTPSA